MSFAIGENIGPYRIVEQLGQGGMATVYKAYHASLDRYVAIKVLHPAFTEDPNFLARFQREARVVARLEHPNIVPIYDYSEHEGRPYLVMKFIEGETLKAAMERAPLSLAQTLTILEAVGAALAYAHEQNVLHRDVKPSNVLLAKDKNIYLADFGLARMAQMGESSLTSDRLVGTPQYISPEQALSKPNLDARTDVYSLGVTLYEMVVGRVPFNADTPFAIIHDHIYTPLPLPRQVNPQVPEAVERVLLRALAKDPNDRFADVSSLVNAFRAALKGELGEGMSSPVISPSFARAPTAQVPPVATAPTLLKLTVEKASDPVSPPTVVASTAVPAAEMVAAKPHRPPAAKYWMIGIVAVVLIAAVTCLILFNRLPEILQKLGITKQDIVQMVSDETPMPFDQGGPVNQGNPPALTSQPPAQDVMTLAEKAVTAWDQGNLIVAGDLVQKIVDQARDDWARYSDVFDYWAGKEAWLLVGMAAYRSGGVELTLPSDAARQMVHRALYELAKDPLAGDFLKQHADNPLFVVATTRRELYFGDPAAAKESLGKLLNRPVELKRFPEALLLQGELYIQLKDIPAATKALEEVKAAAGMPDWIVARAGLLLEMLKTNP